MKAATVLAAAFNMDKAISIHAAREGGDMHTSEKETSHKVFQSTPPVKAATGQNANGVPLIIISIHAAREGGDLRTFRKIFESNLFQSTPPVKAATLLALNIVNGNIKFQSTPPVKAATRDRKTEKHDYRISIHAAREGGDCLELHVRRMDDDFNPRRP